MLLTRNENSVIRASSPSTSLSRALVIAYDKLDRELQSVLTGTSTLPPWRSGAYVHEYANLPTDRNDFDRHRNLRQEMLNIWHSMYLSWHVPLVNRDYRLYFPPDTQDELGGFLESVLYGAQRISQFSSASAVPSVFGTVVEQARGLFDAFMQLRGSMRVLCAKFISSKPPVQDVTDTRVTGEYDTVKNNMITFDTKWVQFEHPFITSLVGTMEEPPKMIQVHDDAITLMTNALRRSTLRSPMASRTPGYVMKWTIS